MGIRYIESNPARHSSVCRPDAGASPHGGADSKCYRYPESNCHRNPNAYGDTCANGHSNPNSYGDTNLDQYTRAYTDTHPDPTTTTFKLGTVGF